jgi:hypothetical protein
MGHPKPRLILSRLERCGLAYTWSALLMMLLLVSVGRLVPAPAIPVCLCLVFAYILSGFGLLASVALRPWLRRLRPKPRAVPSRLSGPLWDRQVDG